MSISVNTVHNNVENYQAEPAEEKSLQEKIAYEIAKNMQTRIVMDRIMDPCERNGGKPNDDEE